MRGKDGIPGQWTTFSFRSDCPCTRRSRQRDCHSRQQHGVFYSRKVIESSLLAILSVLPDERPVWCQGARASQSPRPLQAGLAPEVRHSQGWRNASRQLLLGNPESQPPACSCCVNLISLPCPVLEPHWPQEATPTCRRAGRPSPLHPNLHQVPGSSESSFPRPIWLPSASGYRLILLLGLISLPLVLRFICLPVSSTGM